MIVHYGFLKMKVQSLTCVLLVLCCVLYVFSFEVDHPFSGQSVLWDQRGYCSPLFLTPLIFLLRKIAVMNWSEPKSYNKPFELMHSWDSGLGANDPDIGTPLAKAGCLQ